MTDRSILFSGPMVRALLDGRKTQTRRVLNPQPYRLREGWPGFWNASGVVGGRICISDRALLDLHHKPVAGDRLYVREAWRAQKAFDHLSPTEIGAAFEAEHGAPWCPVFYEADKRCDGSSAEIWQQSPPGRIRQAMHMPRFASRLALAVTDVRVQRLQEISPEDARDEGVDRRSKKVRQIDLFGATVEERDRIYLQACICEYEDLWDRLNAARGLGWDTNPWIVAISFSVHRGNIDQMDEAPE